MTGRRRIELAEDFTPAELAAVLDEITEADPTAGAFLREVLGAMLRVARQGDEEATARFIAEYRRRWPDAEDRALTDDEMDQVRSWLASR